MKIIEVTESNGLTTMNNASVALFSFSKDQVTKRCLGSGFLVLGQDFQLMTAAHVLKNFNEKTESLYFAYDMDSKDEDDNSIWNFYPIETIEFLPNIDIAVCFLSDELEPDTNVTGFKIADVVNRNADILNLEYSGATDSRVYQSLRKGNIVHMSDWEYEDDLKGVNIMETSFACLSGASGSPLIDVNKSHYVIGMMIQNVDHELAPTRTIKAYDDTGGVIEEITYLMPQGLAISAYGIQKALASRNDLS